MNHNFNNGKDVTPDDITYTEIRDGERMIYRAFIALHPCNGNGTLEGRLPKFYLGIGDTKQEAKERLIAGIIKSLKELI